MALNEEFVSKSLLEILFKIFVPDKVESIGKRMLSFLFKGGTYAFICREYLWKEHTRNLRRGELETGERCFIFHYYFFVLFNFTVLSTLSI